MSEPYLGEIRIFAGSFAPKGWAFCNGQLLPINQNQALFSLLGTAYGGNGMTTFALPDLRGRVPVHFGRLGDEYILLGQAGGEEGHTLSIQELPAHTHSVNASSGSATEVSPKDRVWAEKENAYGALTLPTNSMHASAISSVGGGQAHYNMQPFLVLNFIIALQGIYPSQN
ncbi:phage tail protein [Brevibacillus sp. SYSU BS000544]|uniref:phage tail protein n=1 Tax=Brevibacillus sp. SYSU BS000544 TaxID=3416443 RepID=UPI003CE534A5